jgi:hypothetical protein
MQSSFISTVDLVGKLRTCSSLCFYPKKCRGSHAQEWVKGSSKKLLVLPSLLSPVLLSFLLSLFLIAHTLDVSDFLVMGDA